MTVIVQLDITTTMIKT